MIMRNEEFLKNLEHLLNGVSNFEKIEKHMLNDLSFYSPYDNWDVVPRKLTTDMWHEISRGLKTLYYEYDVFYERIVKPFIVGLIGDKEMILQCEWKSYKFTKLRVVNPLSGAYLEAYESKNYDNWQEVLVCPTITFVGLHHELLKIIYNGSYELV